MGVWLYYLWSLNNQLICLARFIHSRNASDKFLEGIELIQNLLYFRVFKRRIFLRGTTTWKKIKFFALSLFTHKKPRDSLEKPMSEFPTLVCCYWLGGRVLCVCAVVLIVVVWLGGRVCCDWLGGIGCVVIGWVVWCVVIGWVVWCVVIGGVGGRVCCDWLGGW